MIEAIIVDDEENARQALHLMLKEHCEEVRIVGFAKNIEEARDLLERLKPDLMFLDIQMPGGSGIELVENYYGDTAIVFTTAYGNHAITAVKLSAFDYLLKPIDYRELIETVQRFSKSSAKTTKDFEILKELLTQEKIKRISISTKEGFDIIELKDLICCEAAKSYTIFHMKDGQNVVSSKPISEFESSLKDMDFLRVHRSFLVNIAHVISYKKGRSGEVKLSNGEFIEVARSKRDELLNRIA